MSTARGGGDRYVCCCGSHRPLRGVLRPRACHQARLTLYGSLLKSWETYEQLQHALLVITSHVARVDSPGHAASLALAFQPMHVHSLALQRNPFLGFATSLALQACIFLQRICTPLRVRQSSAALSIHSRSLCTAHEIGSTRPSTM